jgi:antitoxin component of RelBE/YafQ-DinJ toxin-antitoxin module
MQENYINIKTDSLYVKTAENWITENGYTLESVLDSLFRSIADKKSLPKELIEEITYPERNRKLDEMFDQTIRDYKAGKIKGYKNAEEMWQALEAEDEEI